MGKKSELIQDLTRSNEDLRSELRHYGRAVTAAKALVKERDRQISNLEKELRSMSANYLSRTHDGIDTTKALRRAEDRIAELKARYNAAVGGTVIDEQRVARVVTERDEAYERIEELEGLNKLLQEYFAEAQDAADSMEKERNDAQAEVKLLKRQGLQLDADGNEVYVDAAGVSHPVVQSTGDYMEFSVDEIDFDERWLARQKLASKEFLARAPQCVIDREREKAGYVTIERAESLSQVIADYQDIKDSMQEEIDRLQAELEARPTPGQAIYAQCERDRFKARAEELEEECDALAKRLKKATQKLN